MRFSESDYGLGAELPADWNHVEQYPARAGVELPALGPTNRILHPWLRERHYNQGGTGECAGFSNSRACTIRYRLRFDAEFIYMEGTGRDPFKPDFDPNTGTTLRAVADELRLEGHRRLTLDGVRYAQTLKYGFSENRWATRIEDVQAALADGIPVVVACDWHRSFDGMFTWNNVAVDAGVLGAARATVEAQHPKSAHAAILERVGAVMPAASGGTRGRHAFALFGSLRDYGAFQINSWGEQYLRPLWTWERLQAAIFGGGGECMIPTFR